MFHLREHRAREEFWEGVRDQSSVAMGIGAWALMTGVAMVQSGLSVLEAVLMTLIVYAGSAQLAAVPMITAGAPMWVILAPASASTCASWCSPPTCGPTSCTCRAGSASSPVTSPAT